MASVEDSDARAEKRSGAGAVGDLAGLLESMSRLNKTEEKLIENNREMEKLMRAEIPSSTREEDLREKQIGRMWDEQNDLCVKVDWSRRGIASSELSKSELMKLPQRTEMKGSPARKAWEGLEQVHKSRVERNAEVERILRLCEQAEQQDKLAHMLQMLKEVTLYERGVLMSEKRLADSQPNGVGQLTQIHKRLCREVQRARTELTSFCSDEQQSEDICTANDAREIENRIDEIKQKAKELELHSDMTNEVVAKWEDRREILRKQNDASRRKQVDDAKVRCDVEADVGVELPGPMRTTSSAPLDFDQAREIADTAIKSDASTLGARACSVLVVLAVRSAFSQSW